MQQSQQFPSVSQVNNSIGQNSQPPLPVQPPLPPQPPTSDASKTYADVLKNRNVSGGESSTSANLPTPIIASQNKPKSSSATLQGRGILLKLYFTR